MNVTPDHVEERVDHLRLKVRTDAAHHSEIEERQVSAIHHQQIPRMRISMKETVLEQLLQIRANQHAVNFNRRYAIRAESFEVNHLRAATKAERQHAPFRA